MKKLVVSQRAQADLQAIARYTELRWGKRQGAAYLGAFRNCFGTIRQNPLSGRDRSDIAEGCRSIECGRHVLFYRDTPDAILILRILHGLMDFRRHMEKE